VRGATAAGSQKTVALTFDDGPGEWTPQVLAILKKKGVRATFFVIGRQAAAQPGTIRAIADSGHLVENHTWSHRIPSMSRGWKVGFLSSEIARTSRTITAAGAKACMFRPPGGVVRGALRPASAAGLSTVLWSVDTRDWDSRLAVRAKRPEQIRHRAQVGLGQPHPILLLHDGGGDRAATVAALPGIIDDFRTKGYRFVRMDGRP
jgi:peptidoglycan/xylan/chitin deacetylase (PgdA/CDA1 family)